MEARLELDRDRRPAQVLRGGQRRARSQRRTRRPELRGPEEVFVAVYDVDAGELLRPQLAQPRPVLAAAHPRPAHPGQGDRAQRRHPSRYSAFTLDDADGNPMYRAVASPASRRPARHVRADHHRDLVGRHRATARRSTSRSSSASASASCSSAPCSRACSSRRRSRRCARSSAPPPRSPTATSASASAARLPNTEVGPAQPLAQHDAQPHRPGIPRPRPHHRPDASIRRRRVATSCARRSSRCAATPSSTAWARCSRPTRSPRRWTASRRRRSAWADSSKTCSSSPASTRRSRSSSPRSTSCRSRATPRSTPWPPTRHGSSPSSRPRNRVTRMPRPTPPSRSTSRPRSSDRARSPARSRSPGRRSHDCAAAARRAMPPSRHVDRAGALRHARPPGAARSTPPPQTPRPTPSGPRRHRRPTRRGTGRDHEPGPTCGRARRGEQDPPGHHQPDGQRDPVHLRRQPDRDPRLDRRCRRASDDRGRRPRRGHPPADPGEDLPALLARRHVAHPRDRRLGPRPRDRRRRSSPRTTGRSTCSRRPGGGATFRVSLPLAGSPSAPQSVTDA